MVAVWVCFVTLQFSCSAVNLGGCPIVRCPGSIVLCLWCGCVPYAVKTCGLSFSSLYFDMKNWMGRERGKEIQIMCLCHLELCSVLALDFNTKRKRRVILRRWWMCSRVSWNREYYRSCTGGQRALTSVLIFSSVTFCNTCKNWHLLKDGLTIWTVF